MLDVCDFQPQDLQGLSPDAMAEVAAKLLPHICEQSRYIGEQS